MKKYFLLFLSVYMLHGTVAQVSIQPMLPLVGLVQKDNLWNIAIVNTSTDTYECRIELILRDRASGLEVLTAVTGPIKVSGGTKQLNAALLLPLQYNYISASLSNRTGDFIPVGNYIACYRLALFGKPTLAEECVAFDIEPLSPPMLINPADSSTLQIAPSQFSWIPPAPLNLFSRLGYELRIAEILPGQKAEEAIQQNLPFYTEPDIPVYNLVYTGAATNFEKGKWYAWQVVARDDRNYAGKTEAWVFRVSEEKAEQASNNSSYARLKTDNNEMTVAQDGILKIVYRNELADTQAAINIFELGGNNSKPSHFKTKLITGDNYILYNLNNIMKPQEQKVYKAILTNSRGEQSAIRFIVKYTSRK